MDKQLTPEFSASELETLFREHLGRPWHTRLMGGAEEPLYVPADGDEPARIYYTRDYFRSALHEIAHWCIAGARRRGRRDYGYWYAPDGRDEHQQALFEAVEEKPQALELLFCAACGHEFCVSLDNLNGDGGSSPAKFEARVLRRARAWLEQGSMPARGASWMRALAAHYGRGPGPGQQQLNAVFKPLP